MFEGKHEKLAPLSVFLKRFLQYLAGTMLLVMLALGIGVAGYHWIAGLAWVDALLNAAMILGGMGPVDQLTTTGGKLFATGYALFSGLLFIILMGITLAPLLHRMLHKFHLNERDVER
jgi:hypothetical protein